MNDVATIEATIDWLKSYIPSNDDMPNLLADDSFYRGRIAQVYTMIMDLEYLLLKEESSESWYWRGGSYRWIG